MWWLVVFFLVKGEWVAGADLDHWSPRPHESRAVCLERKAFAVKARARLDDVTPTKWFCTRDKTTDLERLEAREDS